MSTLKTFCVTANFHHSGCQMHHTQFVTDCCLHYAIQDGSVSVAGVDAHVKPEQVKGLKSSASIAARRLNNLFEFQPMGPGYSAAALVLFTWERTDH